MHCALSITQFPGSAQLTPWLLYTCYAESFQLPNAVWSFKIHPLAKEIYQLVQEIFLRLATGRQCLILLKMLVYFTRFLFNCLTWLSHVSLRSSNKPCYYMAFDQYEGQTGCLVIWLVESRSSYIPLLDGYSSCPSFSQCDWLIIGQDSAILPDGFSCQKLKTHV